MRLAVERTVHDLFAPVRFVGCVLTMLGIHFGILLPAYPVAGMEGPVLLGLMTVATGNITLNDRRVER